MTEPTFLLHPWGDIAAATLIVYLVTSYLVAAKVGSFIRKPILAWLQGREANLFMASADSTDTAAQIKFERSAARYAWVAAGIRCRVCVGQWVAFVAYSWLAGWSAPWTWGFAGWATAVLINALHSIALEAIGRSAAA